MGLRAVQGDVVLTLTAAGAGTVTSGPVANAGAVADVVLLVHVSATSGTPSLAASLEESADNSSWTGIPGTSITALTAAGSATVNARTTKNYVRVTTTVSGGTPSVTGRAAVLVIPE